MRNWRWRFSRQTRRRLRQTIRIIAVAALMGWMVFGTLGKVEEMLFAYSDACCRNLLTQAVSESVSELQTSEKSFDFTEIGNQDVVLLNNQTVLRYQAELGAALSGRLQKIAEQEYPVALGTALDSRLLMERGPEIRMRYQPVGSVTGTVHSSLQAAGINQVLYRVTMDLSFQVSVILPGRVHTVTHEQQIVLAEMLLCGEVPYVYGG